MQTTRIKDEIKHLYRKKDILIKSIYKMHLQAANEWGNNWHIIRDSIHNAINQTFENKHKVLENKLNRLTNTQKQKINHTTTFYPRVVNKTDINITKDELDLLSKGLKYNLQHKNKFRLRNLACEAESAITMLPPNEQD